MNRITGPSAGAIQANSTGALGTETDDSADTSLLPSVPTIAAGSDPAAQIAALLLKLGQSQKTGDDHARAVAEATEDAQESQQVDSMREKASAMQTGAWVSGGLDLAAGAASVAGVATMNVGTTGDISPTRASAYLQSASKTSEASAKFAGSMYAASEAQTDASITAADHAASHAKRAADDAKNDSDDAQKYIDQVIDFCREYEAASAQATQATLHRS